ncbi:MAG: bifunctional DNA-formamidopyrimidine glycosylase/DNA-(apurinic or apyrimidinic site) lyase [Candidatus Omnitrophota bacterium]
MPELPEVQTIVNELIDLNVVHRRIRKVCVFWRRSVDGLTDREVNKALSGKIITAVYRRGKYLVFDIGDDDIFVIHLRMSGRLRYVHSEIPADPHEHVVIKLENDFEIRFYDPRKFGRLYVSQVACQKISRLGIEPLSRAFTVSEFEEMLSARQRMLKPLLLDQSFIAGLGNIYTDEALWLARIHPQRLSNSLSAAEIKELHHSIRLVLRQGILNSGTSLGEGKGNFLSVKKKRGRNRLQLKVYGRSGQKCLRCGTPIKRIVVAQRATHICDSCQKE